MSLGRFECPACRNDILLNTSRCTRCTQAYQFVNYTVQRSKPVALFISIFGSFLLVLTLVRWVEGFIGLPTDSDWVKWINLVVVFPALCFALYKPALTKTVTVVEAV